MYIYIIINIIILYDHIIIYYIIIYYYIQCLLYILYSILYIIYYILDRIIQPFHHIIQPLPLLSVLAKNIVWVFAINSSDPRPKLELWWRRQPHLVVSPHASDTSALGHLLLECSVFYETGRWRFIGFLIWHYSSCSGCVWS